MEELLPGKVTPVNRVGGTVRRRPGPTTPAVHVLLNYIRVAGFREAPLPLGFDEAGREIVTFVEGEVWHDPLPDVVWLDRTLADAASLLRRLHDATVGFEPPAGAAWQVVLPPDLPVEVICHNDFAPYNAVFRAGLLCDAYGQSDADRAALVDVVVRRVAALRDRVTSLADQGDEASLRHLADGDAAEYGDDVAYLLSVRPVLEGAL